MQKLIYIACIIFVINTTSAAVITGNPKGEVSVDFIYDYQCDFCHKMWQEIKKIDDAHSNIKIKLHPIYAINNTSLMQAASMIYLALNTDKFFELNDYLLSSKPLNSEDFTILLQSNITLDNNFMKSIRAKVIKDQIDEGIAILSKYNTEKVPFIVVTGKSGKTVTLQGYQKHSKILKEVQNVS